MIKLFWVLFLFNLQVYAQETFKEIWCLDAGGYYGYLSVVDNPNGETVVVRALQGFTYDLAKQLDIGSPDEYDAFDLNISFNPQDCSLINNDQFTCEGKARITFSLLDGSKTEDWLKTRLEIIPQENAHFTSITIQARNGLLAVQNYHFFQNGLAQQGCNFL